MRTFELTESRRGRLKYSYAVRHLDREKPLTVLEDRSRRPRHSDLIVATVDAVGQHKYLEQPDGRKSQLYVGDEVIVACAPRYAPDQFEAEVADDLGPCDLVAAGGIAARVVGAHAKMTRPTQLSPVGFLADASGTVLNVADIAPFSPGRSRELARGNHVPSVVVVGTSMNSGKTTTACSLVHGLAKTGLKVGAIKITGTGAGGDPWAYRDAGADEVFDFGDAGLASTFRVDIDHLTEVALCLHGESIRRGMELIVIEIADGLLQAETSRLVRRPEIRALADAVVFAAADSAGAALGSALLDDAGLTVNAISGLLTASPLALREAQAVLPVPVYSAADLREPAIATGLLNRTARGAVPSPAGQPSPVMEA